MIDAINSIEQDGKIYDKLTVNMSMSNNIINIRLIPCNITDNIVSTLPDRSIFIQPKDTIFIDKIKELIKNLL